MFQSVAGARLDAACLAGNPPLHQLNAELALRFEQSDYGTRLRVVRQEPPWKVVRAFRQPNDAALVHLHNVSGGILAGDFLTLRIEVGANAAAQITSTGATRLYRHRVGASRSEQCTSISVGEDGLLEYLPDPLIPFAASRHVQRTAVTLAKQASLFWWEVIAPGRLAMGERLQYESLQVETAVRTDARPLILENYLLEPGKRPLTSVARMGPYFYLASFYAVRVGWPAADLRTLESQLNEVAGEASRQGVYDMGSERAAF